MINTQAHSLDCGGLIVRYSFLFPETGFFFDNYLGCDTKAALTIQVSPSFLEENRWLVSDGEKSEAFLEFQALMLKTGNELLMFDRALFHGPALIWKDRAWIFTAPSGTGKTTQIRYWNKLFRDEVQVINGDKPLIECRKDGSVMVHASPWRGKEKLGIKGLSAPLGGIILLEQGQENHIERLSSGDAAIPLFTEFVSYPENTDQILSQARILQQILDLVPVWKLINTGNEKTVQLTHDTLSRYLEDKDERI